MDKKQLYIFEVRTCHGQWSQEACGEQSEHNALTYEAAERELPKLAEVLDCDIQDLRIVELGKDG